jgi:hypothetical protein
MDSADYERMVETCMNRSVITTGVLRNLRPSLPPMDTRTFS